jgi:hypothetical protein
MLRKYLLSRGGMDKLGQSRCRCARAVHHRHAVLGPNGERFRQLDHFQPRRLPRRQNRIGAIHQEQIGLVFRH